MPLLHDSIAKIPELTFEHVPPQAAGNDEAVKVYAIEEWLVETFSRVKYPAGTFSSRDTVGAHLHEYPSMMGLIPVPYDRV